MRKHYGAIRPTKFLNRHVHGNTMALSSATVPLPQAYMAVPCRCRIPRCCHGSESNAHDSAFNCIAHDMADAMTHYNLDSIRAVVDALQSRQSSFTTITISLYCSTCDYHRHARKIRMYRQMRDLAPPMGAGEIDGGILTSFGGRKSWATTTGVEVFGSC